MQLSFGGYDAKLPELAESVVNAVKSFDAVSYSLQKDNLSAKRLSMLQREETSEQLGRRRPRRDASRSWGC